jgi:hypothetical protein
MKLAGHFILCLAAIAGLSPIIRADDLAVASNPYSTITERNVFALVPIPVVVPGSDAPPPDPPPKITVNGLMTLFGKPQALFKFTPKAPAGQPAKESSLTLGEGEREEEVEVTKIDMVAHVVSFINHGHAEDVPLSDTAKLTTPVPAPVLGGTPSIASASGGIPLPAARAGLNPAAAARLARAAGAGANPSASPADTAAAGAATDGGNKQIYNPASESSATADPEVGAAKIANNYLNTKAKDPSKAVLFPLSDADKQLLENAATVK